MNLGNEDRLIELEIKMTRQEDVLDALNQTIYQQQKKIDELEKLCAALARHVRELRDAAGSGGMVSEKPPHY